VISGEDQPSTAPLPRGVRRALEAMHANVGHRWRVSELASLSGVSSRTLQRQFTCFLGKSPQAVQHDIGIEQARHALLQGAPGEKVRDVALRCGFPHFGRFSGEYRRRYGETPSSTLKRQSRFVAELAARPAILPPSRDRPIVALSAIETGPEHGEMAGSLAEDLSIALARAGLSVVSETRFARYQVQAAIRGIGAHKRLVIQLFDHETGRQLWAHRTEGMRIDGSESHEELATRIVAQLQPSLRSAEIERAWERPDNELGPHDLALRAMPGVLSLNAEGNAQALELLEQALHRNPESAIAAALAAWAYAQRVIYHFTTDLTAERARGIDLAHKALSLSGDATALAVLGNALTLLDELDSAALVIRKSLATDGGCAWAWSRSGWLDVYRGDPESAIERFKIALDIAPQDSLAFNSMVGIGCAHFKAGNYVEAARWQERALREHPSAIWVHRTLCPAYVLAGQGAEARRSLDALRSGYPDLTVSDVQLGMPPLPESYRSLLIEGLADAGLPA
jgi:AraC-like DNA-binding protein/tetratricopeptide (TPR) repeat protein